MREPCEALVTDEYHGYAHNGLQRPDARMTSHPVFLGLGVNPAERGTACRALFRPQLDAEAAPTIPEALRLGMPFLGQRE